jgi:hypothetical protein
MPQELRVQIIHILQDVIGNPRVRYSFAGQLYQDIHNDLAREYGLFKLAEGIDPVEVLFNFILQTPDVKKVLDAIEASFARIVRHMQSHGYNDYRETKMDIHEAISAFRVLKTNS